MSDPAIHAERLLDLAGAICNKCASENELVELDSILFADRAYRRRYLDYCRIHVTLRLDSRAHRAALKVRRHIDAEPAVPAPGDLDAARTETSSTVPLGFLAANFPGTIGYSSGWAVSYLLATAITGLLLFGFWLMPVSRPEQVVRQSDSLPSPLSPLPSVVGRITGLVDCQWNGGSRVSLGQKCQLASGLMEITYDTGAKVILQGPVTYEVESNGGYLSVGKLTGKLEKGNGEARMTNDEGLQNSSFVIRPSSFVIHTPTATVTDLGTEFGVEVTKDQQSRTYVFQGKIVVRTQGSAQAAPREIELGEGESASVKPQGTVTRFARHQAEAPVDATFFVRKVRRPTKLLAYWPMDEGQGTTVHDQAKNHIDGSLVGGEWTAGKFGKAVKLSGGAQYVEFRSNPRFLLDYGDFTVSFWFKGANANSATDWRWLINMNSPGFDDYALVIATWRNRLRISMGNWFTDVLADQTTVFNNSDWYHIALTRCGTVVVAYVNGVQEGSNSFSNARIGYWGGLYLGTGPCRTESLKGAIDDVAIWNRALTPTQIKALVNGTATPLNVLNVDQSRPEDGGGAKLSGDGGHRTGGGP